MTPKRVVLCIDSDPTALGIRRYMLEVRGFRVLTACSVASAIEQLFVLPEMAVEVVMLCDPRASLSKMAGLAKVVKDLRPGVKVLVAANASPYDILGPEIDALLTPHQVTPAHVLDKLKRLIMRKRGAGVAA